MQRPWGRGELAVFDDASEEPGCSVGAVALVRGGALDKGGGTGGGKEWTQLGRRQKWGALKLVDGVLFLPQEKSRLGGRSSLPEPMEHLSRGGAVRLGLPGGGWPWKSRGRGW